VRGYMPVTVEGFVVGGKFLSELTGGRINPDSIGPTEEIEQSQDRVANREDIVVR
jgi:hypothetical protein